MLGGFVDRRAGAMKGEGCCNENVDKRALLLVVGRERKQILLKLDGTRRDQNPRRASVWRFFFSSATFPFLACCGNPTDPTGRPRRCWGSGRVCSKIQGPRRRIHDGHCRGPRPHRNLIGCQRNQGPRTRTSLLRHQLSRRKPSPVHKAYGAWAAWKMLPRRHCSDVPRTSPDILEPSGDSASGCIAPKPSPDPVLTPSQEKPVNPQGASGEPNTNPRHRGRRVLERLSGLQGAHLWESADRDANRRANGFRSPTWN